MEPSKIIGVIGGMGAAASHLFYGMVTEMTAAEKDQDHLRLLLYSDASMPDRTGAILKEDYETVEAQLLDDAKLLEQAGCQAICITCNTAHFFADRIKDRLSIPILHMLDLTTARIQRVHPGGKVAILATDGTVKTKIYQNRLSQVGLKPYLLPADYQKGVMAEIYDRVKAGKPHDSQFWKDLDKHLHEEGCDAAILGCTELSVIKKNGQLPAYYVDPMKILAAEAIRFSGRQVKGDQEE